MTVHAIAVIPGDGIGREVMPERMRVLDAVAGRFGIELRWQVFDWSCETCEATGRMMPEDGLDRPAVTGTIYLAPSANLDPERAFPSMFEPVHGSAPDIAGQGIANPIGQIWSGAMMLEHLGHADAAAAVVHAIEAVLRDRAALTPDMGGRAGTADLGAAVAQAL